MRLRPAGPDDVPVVAGIEATVFGGDAWSADTVEAELLGAHRHALVAEVAAEVVGYVVVMVSSPVADLNRIAVEAPHRRAGVAGALLAIAAERVYAEGARSMLLEVAEDNAAALAFYHREGFVQIARRDRYYRDGHAAVVMQRHITGPGPEQHPR